MGFKLVFVMETTLVILVDNLRIAIDKGSASLLILLNLSVAFNTIHHGICLGYLSGMESGDIILRWWCFFLEGRFQKVLLGESCSTF